MAGNGRPQADSFSGDEALIVALASGRDVRQAAEAAGVSERTAYRRLSDPEFRRRVNEARALFIDKALGRLSEASTKAVDTLVELLDANSETAKLGACRLILEQGTRLRESVDLERRIWELENRANQSSQANGETGTGGGNLTAWRPVA